MKMKKILSLVVGTVLVFNLFSTLVIAAPTPTAKPKVDAVTTASIVNTQAAFIKAIGAKGTWIIATLKDLKVDKALVLEGQFKNKDVIARKIALYTQDDKRVVTARFTLTAPKLTIKSENAKIQGGTFVGDIYVEAKGFTVSDATVKGNIYFKSDAIKKTFKLDKAKVTGVQKIKK